MTNDLGLGSGSKAALGGDHSKALMETLNNQVNTESQAFDDKGKADRQKKTDKNEYYCKTRQTEV